MSVLDIIRGDLKSAKGKPKGKLEQCYATIQTDMAAFVNEGGEKMRKKIIHQ